MSYPRTILSQQFAVWCSAYSTLDCTLLEQATTAMTTSSVMNTQYVIVNIFNLVLGCQWRITNDRHLDHQFWWIKKFYALTLKTHLPRLTLPKIFAKFGTFFQFSGNASVETNLGPGHVGAFRPLQVHYDLVILRRILHLNRYVSSFF